MRGSAARLAGIDLLRGTAVVLVMLHHALPAVFSGSGLVGVVMFFTLSGYLITGVLQSELDEGNGLDLRGFYRRRIARLVPALVALTLIYAIVSFAWTPLGDHERMWPTVLYALTWTTNLPIAHPSSDMFHLWTLATEEQFYLLWPALLLAAYARRRPSLAYLIAGTAAAAGCLATVVWLAESPDLAYALPTSWAGCFVVGGLARAAGARARQHMARLAPVGGLVIALMSMIPWRGHALTYVLGGPAISFATCTLLVTIGRLVRVRHPLARTLLAVGTVSYAAYLWNYPLTIWGRESLGWFGGLVAVPATFALAALSWRLIEQPAQRWILGVGTAPMGQR